MKESLKISSILVAIIILIGLIPVLIGHVLVEEIFAGTSDSPTDVGREALTIADLSPNMHAGWQEVGFGSAEEGGISNNEGQSFFPSLAAAPNGDIFVAWQDQTNGREIYVAYWNGVVWSGLNNSNSGQGISNLGESRVPSLAISLTGIPYIAWETPNPQTGFTEIYLKYWDGDSWEELGGSATNGGISINTSDTHSEDPDIAINSDGVPYVVWKERTSFNREIYIRYWDGIAWSEVTPGSASDDGIGRAYDVFNPSISIAPGGEVYVAWMVWPSFSEGGEIHLIMWNKSEWMQLNNSASGGGISNTTGDSGYPSVAIQGNDTVYVAWSDWTEGREIYVRRWFNNEWQEVGINSASGGGVSNTFTDSHRPSIDISPDGTPYLVWADADHIYVRRWINEQWEEVWDGSAHNQGISGQTSVSDEPSIAFRQDGVPFIAWQGAWPGRINEIYVRQWMHFLDLPIAYSEFSIAAQGHVIGTDGRVNSWFDHTYPGLDKPLNYDLSRWDGKNFDSNSGYGIGIGQGIWWYDNHDGIDFSNVMFNEPVYSVAKGTVIEAGWNPDGCGYGVKIDHYNGYASRYCHLSSVSIDKGTVITNTEITPIGIMGETGEAYSLHLHFVLFKDVDQDGIWEYPDEMVDPYGWYGSISDPWSPNSLYLWKYPTLTQEMLDSNGGSLLTPAEDVKISIPQNALTESVTLELWNSSSIAAPEIGLRSTGNIFQFRVLDWLNTSSILESEANDSFSSPITITVYYTDAATEHLDIDQLKIYRRNETNHTWDALDTTVDRLNRSATAFTVHTGLFDLQAPLLYSNDSQEPNDNLGDAFTILPNGETITHLFDTPLDEDWFALYMRVGGRYMIQTANLAPDVSTILELYNGNGTLLSLSDDHSGEIGSYIEWKPLSSGTYFIRVTNKGVGYGNTATYDLNVAEIYNINLPIVLKN